MEENKNTNKKIVLGVAALVAVFAILAVIFIAFRPRAVAGSKSIVIEVVNKEKDKASYNMRTDAEFLRQAMDEADGLTYEETDGFVNTVNGETADFNVDGSYWAIYVNDDYGMYGINDQPVADGDKYRFEYTIYE